MSFLSRVPASAVSEGPEASAVPGEWGGLYPALTEFLTATRWPEGDARTPGSLTVFTEAGAWKGCLNDKDQHRLCFCTALSPVKLLEALEVGLVGSSLDWRAARPFSGRNGKKGA